ncbi:MAG: hypothetical protein KC560_16460 [Myxococcales bacterium]|nr:hypothetical protein [Myxococcales bacterium]
MATLGGPITGGRGHPFGCPPFDVAERGYVMEEFVLSGRAGSFRVADGGSAGRDGRWDVEAGDEADFVTRAYVVRPAAPEAFNGVAVVNWQNVTLGVDLGLPLADELYRGCAWVGVSAQAIGIDGACRSVMGIGSTTGLRDWDRERYGSLHHPGDAHSYDIFSQAGRLVRSGELLGGLVPDVLVASGASQSAMRLGSYLNAVHPTARVFDGFHLTVHWGICPPLEEMDLPSLFTPADDLPSVATCAIRDEGDARVLVIATECEARFNFPVRQPDTDSFRFWEIAGATHTAPANSDAYRAVHERDGVTTGPPLPDRNDVDWRPVDQAGLRAMVRWVREGRPPRTHPRIEFDAASPPVVARDADGNALGGIRLPELAAPVSSYLGERDEGPETWLVGRTTPLPVERLAELYPSEGDHDTAWNRAVDALLAEELVLEEDAARLKRCDRRRPSSA